VAIVAVFGAKGGVGASLVAANLALALHGLDRCLLIDLHGEGAAADLLLDLAPERSWGDLLPVVGELTERHLELASTAHPLGLMLLAAPEAIPRIASPETIPQMVREAARLIAWTVIDLETAGGIMAVPMLNASNTLIMVATPDPVALRAGRRRLMSLPDRLRKRIGLVINQYDPLHPANPVSIAESLEAELLGVLPREPSLVGEQVNFGRPVVLAGRAPFALQIQLLARRLASSETLSAGEIGRGRTLSRGPHDI
jgi:pilus assembly protein CpaE